MGARDDIDTAIRDLATAKAAMATAVSGLNDLRGRERRDAIRAILAAKAMPAAELASRLGISPARVYQIRRRGEHNRK